MNTIVILLMNEKYRQELLDFFKLPRYELYIRTSEQEVLDVCSTEMVDLILIWDANGKVVSHLQNLLKKSHILDIPVVAVVKDAPEFHAAIKESVYDVFQIPMPRKEFSKLLQPILNIDRNTETEKSPAHEDDLSEASNLINSLHRLSKNKQSALVTVTESGHSGRVYLRDGKIVRAIFRVLEGMDALNKMVGLYKAEMTVHLTEVTDEDQIGINVPEILVQLHQRLKEQQSFFRVDLTDSDRLVTQQPEEREIKVSSELHRLILDLMSKGETVYNLITILNQDNIEILKSVRELLDKKVLIPEKKQARDSTGEVSEEPEIKRYSFFRKLFSWKRKKKEKSVIHLEEESGDLPEEGLSEKSSVPAFTQMDSEVRQKIRNYFSDKEHADS